MRRLGWTFVVLGLAGAAFVLSGAPTATPAPAVVAASSGWTCPEGAQWNITGAWYTVQSNKYTAVWRFKQTGTALAATVVIPQGDARTQGLTSNVGHLVAGKSTLVGNKLDVVLEWQKKSGAMLRGRYTATVEPGEKAGRGKVDDGKTWNVDFPSSQGTWAGNGPATCSGGWPPLPSALIGIEEVSNGCGPGKPSTQPSSADTASFHEQGVRYEVDFREACNLHDAGYSGANVRDRINGGIFEPFAWTKEQVDAKFKRDLHTLCKSQVTAEAKQRHVPEDEMQSVIARCANWSDLKYHEVVDQLGKLFWEERPDLRGAWSGPSNVTWKVAWSITQTGRTVRATFDSDSGPRGEFRGTLISKHNMSVVDGFARITGAGKTAQGDMQMVFFPRTPNQLRVSGPGLSGTITRT